jgi:hypothetical protein
VSLICVTLVSAPSLGSAAKSNACSGLPTMSIMDVFGRLRSLRSSVCQ